MLLPRCNNTVECHITNDAAFSKDVILYKSQMSIIGCMVSVVQLLTTGICNDHPPGKNVTNSASAFVTSSDVCFHY